MKFKSAIDGRIWLPVGLIFTSIFIVFAIERLWLGILLLLPAVAFILHIVFTTVYIITSEGELIIRCGFLYKQRLTVQNIARIVHTTNPLSSPALSLNRLMLFYDKGGKVMISPKDETLFIATLKKQNPQLVVQ